MTSSLRSLLPYQMCPSKEAVPWSGLGVPARKTQVEFLAGGATLNSVRVAQWLLQAVYGNPVENMLKHEKTPLRASPRARSRA